MKEIYLSKRSIGIGVITGIVVALGILAIQALPVNLLAQAPNFPEQDQPAAMVATSAMNEFFHVDYREGKDEWTRRVCALSTPAGCQLITMGSDAMWQVYTSAQTIVYATAIPQEKVKATDTEQVWRVFITLTDRLPGSDDLYDEAYVVLQKTDSTWKFDRFLTKPEISALLARP